MVVVCSGYSRLLWLDVSAAAFSDSEYGVFVAQIADPETF